METDSSLTTETTATPEVQAEPQAIPEKSLSERVASFKAEETKAPETTTNDSFSSSDIESIEDPQAKEYAKQAHKSLEKAYQKKFQDLASLKKEVESLKQENSAWTPEKVNRLLNDPTFVQSAQSIATQQPEQDSYSALSDQERKEIEDLKSKVKFFEQNISQTEKLRQDEHLQTTYANYNATAVDTLTADLLANKVHATREHLWKVSDYDNAVNRAYKLGRVDERQGIGEKVNSSSTTEGLNISQNREVLEKKENESSENYFVRLAKDNLGKLVKNK